MPEWSALRAVARVEGVPVRGWRGRLGLRLSTACQLVLLFARRRRLFLLPLVLVLLGGSIVLVLSELFPAIAPFVYTVI